MKQKVFHLCSGITGVIFFLAVQGINASPSFYLGTDKIFGTHEAPYVNLEGPGYNSYNLRVYRISNPEKFIHENLRQRQVTEKTKKARGNAIALFRSTWSGYKDDFQKVARQELKGRTRVHIKNSLSVKLNAPHPQQQLAVPELLEDHQFLFSRTVSKSSKAWDYRRIPISIDREGFYLIEVIHGMDIAHTVMIKSNVQFMAKQSDNETLIFSARKDSGEPISDVAVDIFNSETGQKIHSSDSNSKGIVFYKGTTPAKSLIVVRHDSEYALSDPNFYSNSYYGKGGVKSYIYTERPVYRPGQKVFFKGIVRNFQNDRYKISSGTASFSVYAENGNVIVENQNLQISNSMGSFSGNFVLPDQDDLYRGVYNLVLLYNQKSYSTEFSVESYKKPRFLVKVNTLKNSYYSRDKIPVTVSAKYYAGNPVVQADVHYRVFRSPRYHYSVVGTIPHFEQSGDYLGQTNTSVQNQLILDKTGKLNESGEFSFVIQPDKHDQDYSYSVITSVTDPSETLGGSRAFSVNRGQFYINIRRENTVYNPGDVMKLKAELVPFDKSLKAAEKKKIVEGISVSADLVSRSFQSISEENSGEVVSEHSSVTDASGTADFSIPIQKSGHYLLRFHTEDKDGNELTADTTLWASAVSDSISIPFRNLVMKAGKDLYSVGEEAEVIIISPVADASLFLALESNRILDYEHVKLKGNIYKYRIPLKNNMSPNFNVSAAIFSGGEIYKSEIKVVVPPREKFLSVSISKDKEIYSPGDTVQLDLEAKDSNNRGARTEISIGVVDEAIYQIKQEKNPSIISFFYHPRRNNVQTTLSSSYRFFGYSETSRLKLALLNDNVPLAAIKDAGMERKKFEDTAFWNATVITDSGGRATVKFKLPDNITTWKVRAVAVTEDTKVGQSETSFISKKDLMVSPGLPSYMLRGKEQVVTANITNHSKKTVQSVFECSVENASIKGNESIKNSTLKPGESKSFTFTIIPSEMPDKNTIGIRMKIRGGGYSDHIYKQIPLQEYGISRSESATVELSKESDAKTEKLSTPSHARFSSMQVRVSPGYGHALRQSLSYLAKYPYGCIEQTMSRFMPVLAAKKAGYITPQIDRELPDMVRKGLLQIKNHQNRDGGFGWFENNEKSDVYMTAFVYRGLAVGKKLKQQVDPGLMNRTRSFLFKTLNEHSLSPTARLYILFSLSEGGEIAPSIVEKLDKSSSDLGPYGKSLAGLILANSNKTEAAKKYFRAALRDAKLDGKSAAVFRKTGENPVIENDMVEITSNLLLLGVRIGEDEETVNRLSSTLLLNRRDFAWNNTRDTASAVLALSERLEKVKDLSGKSIVNIFVNENAAGTVESSPDELFSGKTILDIPVYFLKDKKIKVRFEKVSGPPVYATAILNYKDVSKSFEPENKGFSVKRKYYLVGSETFGSGLKLKESNGNSFQRGDLIMNELSVKRNTGDDRYFMISDPLPPGFSIVRNDHEYYSPDNPVEYNSRQILDNKVVFFVSGPDSEFTIRYFLHADLPGQYSVLPAKSMLMYYPEVYGTTASSTVTIH